MRYEYKPKENDNLFECVLIVVSIAVIAFLFLFCGPVNAETLTLTDAPQTSAPLCAGPCQSQEVK